MKKKKINKKILILLPFVAAFLISYLFLQNLNQIIFVSDSEYYENVIKRQSTNLKLSALKNGMILKIEIVSMENNSINNVIESDDKDSTFIFSPIISYKYKSRVDKLEKDYVSIGINIDDDISKVALLDNSNNGWISLARELKKTDNKLYIISDSSWPGSEERASAFISEFGQSGLTHIKLNGGELKQYALTLIDEIKKEGISNVVFTGSSFILYFIENDDSLLYSVPSSLASLVSYTQLNKVVFEDLTPIIESLNKNDKTILISQGVWDFQEGLKNSLKQLLHSLQSKIY